MKHPLMTFFNSGNPGFRVNFLSSVSFLLILFTSTVAFGQKQKKSANSSREYIEIKVYHAADDGQLAAVDQFLQSSLVPAFHKGGFQRVGVFKAIDNDTAKDKRVYVMIPFQSLTQLEQLASIADKSLGDSAQSPAYTTAAYNKAPFARFETILLRAFEGMPQVKPSGVKTDYNERVYELRSYESPTEALHKNKVKMFNSGEVDLFQRLGFNAVFYGQVIAGSRMPNLMYMTSFENKAARDAHWKTFGSDPVWKKMSSDPIYQNNVSHIDITFLRPASYSGL